MALAGADDGARRRSARPVLLGQAGVGQLARPLVAAALTASLLSAGCTAGTSAVRTDDETAAAARAPLTGFPGPHGARRDTVEKITDGDTVRLRGLGKVRLIGIDTPEVYGAAECYGAEASTFTKRVLRVGAAVRYRLGVEQRDRYGRALAYVWLRDGRMLNALLAAEGYAVPLTIPPNVEYAERFVAAARRARSKRLGLWSESTCAGDADLPAADEGNPGRTEAPPPPAAPKQGGGSGDRDCGDFGSQAEAQSWFESHGGRPGHDVDGLDRDGDGRACTSLP